MVSGKDCININVAQVNDEEAYEGNTFFMEEEILIVKMGNGKICKLQSVRFQLPKQEVVPKHVS